MLQSRQNNCSPLISQIFLLNVVFTCVSSLYKKRNFVDVTIIDKFKKYECLKKNRFACLIRIIKKIASHLSYG